MERRDQTRRDQRAVARIGRGGCVLHRLARHALGGVDAGRTDGNADAAILMKDIVDQVIIIADRRSRAHHEFARRPAGGRCLVLRRAPNGLVMPPGGIADRSFEHADRIRNLDRLAVVLRHGHGEETRIGRTVDAPAQRTEEITKTVFAAVHVGSPIPALVRVHVGNEDFGQMHLVGDRAPARTVTRLDHRKHSPRALVGPQVKTPHVPDEAAFLYCDVVPAGLGKACRFGFGPQSAALSHLHLVITPGFSGDRHHAGIGHIDRLAGFQIDGRKQAFDRAGPDIGVCSAWRSTGPSGDAGPLLPCGRNFLT